MKASAPSLLSNWQIARSEQKQAFVPAPTISQRIAELQASGAPPPPVAPPQAPGAAPAPGAPVDPNNPQAQQPPVTPEALAGMLQQLAGLIQQGFEQLAGIIQQGAQPQPGMEGQPQAEKPKKPSTSERLDKIEQALGQQAGSVPADPAAAQPGAAAPAPAAPPEAAPQPGAPAQ